MMNQARNLVADKQAIILFDGICHFCDASVRFIAARDGRRYFRFAPLQSDVGQELQKKFALKNIDSVVLIENDRAFTRSTAALKVARRLDGAWSSVYSLIVVPKFIRDFVYNLFAQNRYRLFGKKEVCTLPSPELRERFLDLQC